MGLDIEYYSDIAFVHDYIPEEDREEGTTLLYPNSDFLERADGLKRAVYSYCESGSFRAGSYGGYNHWRDQLARLAGYGSAESAWEATGGPFWELIQFSDCEGVIGPVTSAKLAKDFAEYQHAADNHQDNYFTQLYNMWRKAFETAANNGAVDFR